jgi:hypothetical protein
LAAVSTNFAWVHVELIAEHLARASFAFQQPVRLVALTLALLLLFARRDALLRFFLVCRLGPDARELEVIEFAAGAADDAHGAITGRLDQDRMALGAGPVRAYRDPARARREGLEKGFDTRR